MSKLKSHIETTGQSQREFAARVGISPGHLGDLLHGRRTPGLALAIKIEAATDGCVPASYWHSATPEPAAKARRAKLVKARPAKPETRA